MGQTIFIVDELVALPGQGQAVLAAYQARYVPGATARGMMLDRVIVSPPVWLDEASNRLLITWTVDGAGGWWGQAVQSRYDPAVEAFWAETTAMLVSRNRYFGSAAADVEEIAHV